MPKQSKYEDSFKQEVKKLIEAGQSNASIAAQKQVSEHTVRYWRVNLARYNNFVAPPAGPLGCPKSLTSNAEEVRTSVHVVWILLTSIVPHRVPQFQAHGDFGRTAVSPIR